jgi:hypothetical protein
MAFSPGGYASASLRMGDRLTVTPALRLKSYRIVLPSLGVHGEF